MKQKGVTMFEALLASSIIAFALLGYMKYQHTEIRNNLIKEFEYDFKKVLTGLENKIVKDNFQEKKHWAEIFFEKDLNNHLIRNLTSHNSCGKLSTLDFNGRDYINCVPPVRMKVFDVSAKGKISFYSNDDFKSYSLKFYPNKKDELKNIKLLSQAIKRTLKDVSFYSNVGFFIKKENITYKDCLSKPEKCYLKVTFGTRYNYLENEIFPEKTESFYEMNDYSHNISDVFDANDVEKVIKKELEKSNINVSKKDLKKIKNELEKLKDNPDFNNRLKKQLRRKCSQYDEDDYYFMSKHNQDNVCYTFYGR